MEMNHCARYPSSSSVRVAQSTMTPAYEDFSTESSPRDYQLHICSRERDGLEPVPFSIGPIPDLPAIRRTELGNGGAAMRAAIRAIREHVSAGGAHVDRRALLLAHGSREAEIIAYAGETARLWHGSRAYREESTSPPSWRSAS